MKQGGYEERHWLRQDTGYPGDISGKRLLGQNARPRDGQPRSGVRWFASSDLCDTSRPELGCAPKPAAPAGTRQAGRGRHRGAAARRRTAPRTIPELLRSLRPGHGYFTPQLHQAKAKDATARR